MRKFTTAALHLAAAAGLASPVVAAMPERVSEHVWVISGFPNIAIIVGTTGVLVVDTGLGPARGTEAASAAQKLGPGRKHFFTTTHFHPEHAAGDAGFPSDTVLIRDRVQQQDMELHGREMIDLFAGRSEENKQLLADVQLRKPDVLFNSEYRLDLGRHVGVRLLWFGSAHTKGDEVILVEPDRTPLVSGDVVRNKVVPNIYGEGGTPASWLAVLRKLQALGIRRVVPDHSPVGDATLISIEIKFIGDLRARALALRSQGVTSEDAGAQLTGEFKQQYPDRSIKSQAPLVKSIYGEPA